jgi:hypothetical protein
MKHRPLLTLAALFLISWSLAPAADLVGKWTAEFDTQIGVQKYTYEFAADGDKLTGKATFDHSMGKGEAPLKDIKIKGDDVSFVETAKFDSNEVAITYTGKLAGDELKLSRVVGDFATEQLVAKRVKAADAKPESKPAPAK